MKIKQLLSALFISFGILFLSVTSVNAQTQRIDNIQNVASNVTDYFDVFVMGWDQFEVVKDEVPVLTIGGEDMKFYLIINNSILVLGNDVDISGDIARNLFVLGGNFDFEGNVDKNVVFLTKELQYHGAIGGSAIGFSKSINVDSETKAVETVTMNKLVEGNFSPSSIGAAGVGQSITPGFDTPTKSLITITYYIIAWFGKTIGLIILGWVMLKVAPVKVKKSLDKMSNGEEIAKSTAVGFMAVPIVAFLSLFLFISYVGWPLLGVISGLTLVVIQLVSPLVGIRIGQAVVKRFGWYDSYSSALVIGLLVLRVIVIFPVINAIIQSVIILLGLGAFIRMKYDVFGRADAQSSHNTAVQASSKGAKKSR